MRFQATPVFAALITLGQTQGDGLTVQTQQGPVAGSLIIPEVRRFLGIPYALANRWDAPHPLPNRGTTFDATSFGDSCVQMLSASVLEYIKLLGLAGQNVQASEDCLSVNIWTPSTQRKQSTAVMIWLYGGSFTFGTSNTVFFDGEAIVRDHDDILLVTINYRLNIFGFPTAPQLNNPTQSQNFGVLDVQAAVQWVHDNIAGFGGDPNRITLFGQSAGSSLASIYTLANPTDTIVKGVIEQSGSLAGQTSLVTGPFNAKAWNTVAGAVNCGNDSALDQLTCMKAVPFTTLENAVISTGQGFGPVADDITIFADTDARSAAGNFLRVPLLVGNTAQEGDVFIVAAERLSLGFDIPILTPAAADAVTQVGFVCPSGTTAGDYVAAGVPVWRYQYDAIFPDISSTPDLHAFHASEIPIVFGTYNSSPFGPPTDVEISFSRYVQGAWVAFARDPQQGLTNYGWPRYNPNTASLVQLGNTANISGAIFTQGNSFDGGCLLTEAVITLAFDIVRLLGGIL